MVQHYLDHGENSEVFASIVKLFLKRHTNTQEVLQQVLSLATQDSKNPDLRNRGERVENFRLITSFYFINRRFQLTHSR